MEPRIQSDGLDLADKLHNAYSSCRSLLAQISAFSMASMTEVISSAKRSQCCFNSAVGWRHHHSVLTANADLKLRCWPGFRTWCRPSRNRHIVEPQRAADQLLGRGARIELKSNLLCAAPFRRDCERLRKFAPFLDVTAQLFRLRDWAFAQTRHPPNQTARSHERAHKFARERVGPRSQKRRLRDAGELGPPLSELDEQRLTTLLPGNVANLARHAAALRQRPIKGDAGGANSKPPLLSGVRRANCSVGKNCSQA